MTLAFGRFGSVINNLISGHFDSSIVYGAYAVGVVFCAASVSAGCIAVFIDIQYDALHTASSGTIDPLSSGAQCAEDDRPASSRFCGCHAWSLSFISHVKTFKLSFWLLVPICMLGFPTVTAFNSVLSALLSARWTSEGVMFDSSKLSRTMSVLYTVSACLEMCSGYIVDRTHRRGAFLVFALATLAVSHILFALTSLNAAALLAMVGLGFSFLGTSFWPSLMWFVPHFALGMSYGLMGAFQNLGLSIVPLGVAALEPPTCGNSFQCVSFLFVGLATVSMLLAVWLHVLERRQAVAAGDTRGGCVALCPSRCLNKLPQMQQEDCILDSDLTPSRCQLSLNIDSSQDLHDTLLGTGVDLFSPKA